VQVGFEKNEVKKLEFSMPNAPPSVSEHFPSASQVLLENLTLPKASSPLLRKLDKFSTNLERLANLDRLNISSGPHTFNCFEAIAGIHSSLRRLYEHEKQAALALIENQTSRRDERAERLVMCKMSGRPKLNSHGIVGLGIDYWMHNRHTFHDSDRNLGEDDMDIDSAPAASQLNGQDIFTLVIDCESAAPEEYLPARNSDAWISDQIAKQLDLPDATFGAHVDWLDPPPTYLSYSADTTDAMALDIHENKLPGIRFVAKLEPPLEMPLNVAANILAIVNSSQQADELHYYHTLALQTESGKPIAPDQDIVRSKLVAAPGGTENHITTLRCKPIVVGRLLNVIPFEHPKQLVQILPASAPFAKCFANCHRYFASGPW
jgi:Mediator of RNA polymerase II transcription subunit 1